MDFIEQNDWNEDDNPIFNWVNVNEGIPKIIPPKSTIKIIEADRWYEIKIFPVKSSYDNLLIKYTIEQSLKKDGSDKTKIIHYMYYVSIRTHDLEQTKLSHLFILTI